MKRIVTCAAIVALLAACVCGPVRAADSPQGIAVTPPTFDLTANPGDTKSNSIRVDNLTNAPLHLTPVFKNFVALGEDGQVGLSDEESSFSLASWITIDKNDAIIPARGSETFVFTIKVPSNAEPGGRFGSVVFKTDIQKSAAGGLMIGQEIGVLVLLRVAGDVTERAAIEEFRAEKNFYDDGPVPFVTRLKNSGNVHVRPAGTITIIDFFGNKVASLPLDSKNVLPGAIRKLDAQWQQRTLFGKYTATLSLQYGVNQQILTASTSFVVIPWKLVLLWLMIFGLLGVLIYRGRERIKKAVGVLFGKE